MTFVTGVGTYITDEFVAADGMLVYLIGEDEVLGGTDAPAFTFDVGSDGSNLLVAGRIESTWGSAILAAPDTNGVSVRIGRTGEVLGTGDGIVFSGNAETLTNFGTIETTGYNNVAVRFEHDSARMINDGLILAMTGSSDAVNLSGTPTENTEQVVFNTGTIAGVTGIQTHDLFFADIENWGLIYGGDGREAITLGTGTEAARIHNVGVIDGGAFGVLNQSAAAVFFTNSAGATLRTRGDASVLLETDSDEAIAYQGGGGEDAVMNGGTIEGNVRLADGDDSYFGYDAGAVVGRVYGDDGADWLHGGSANDRLYGGSGADLLEGRIGDDRLYGDHGADVLVGGTGRDVLYGGADDDKMRAGSGADTLQGGLGADTLQGGFGADLFVLRTGWGTDTITDFDTEGRIQDTIDLSALASIEDWADLADNHLTQDGADAVIDGLDGDMLVLLGVDVGDLEAADFLF